MDKKRLTFLASGHFVVDAYGAFLPPLLPLLMVNLGLSLTLTATLTSVLSFSSSIFQPVLGYISDRTTKPVFILSGPILAAFFLSFINLADSYWMLVVFLLFGGAGIAAYHPQATAMSGEISGKYRSGGIALFVFGGTAGYALGPLVVTFLISLNGLSTIYWASIPGLLISVILLTAFPLKLKSGTRKHNSLRKALKESSPDLYLLLFISIIRAIVVTGFSTFIPLYFKEIDLPIYTWGLAVFIIHSTGSLSGLLGGFLADILGNKKVLVFSFIMCIPFFYLFTTSSYPLSLWYLGLAGAFILSSMPVLVSAIQTTLPSHLGTVSSLATGFSWGIGGICMPILAIIAEASSIVFMFKIVSFLPVLGFAACMFLSRDKNNVD